MDVAELLQWLGIPSGIIGIGLPLLLWLRGTIMLTSNHDAEVARIAKAHADAVVEISKGHDAEVVAVQSGAELQIQGVRGELRAVNERLAHVVADRDAWRDAHREEATARAAAERAGAAIMEQGQLSLALLGALKDVVANQSQRGDGGTRGS